jgi:hypothetical protein
MGHFRQVICSDIIPHTTAAERHMPSEEGNAPQFGGMLPSVDGRLPTAVLSPAQHSGAWRCVIPALAKSPALEHVPYLEEQIPTARIGL